MADLGLPLIRIDFGELTDTTDRYPFDRVGWEFIARASQLSVLLVEATGTVAGDPGGGAEPQRRPLTLDEAVVGGLLVRVAKLLRALFDSTQSEQSEAHHILARCVVETAVNMRWLLQADDPDEYQRFRADSFVTWLKLLDRQAASPANEDEVARAVNERIKALIESELRAADLERKDIPPAPGSWGKGSFRKRLEDLGLGSLYLSMFATHSYYVHGSWHELRTFHVRGGRDGMELELDYGELAPPVSYETAQVALVALRDYVDAMPLAAIDIDEVKGVIGQTRSGITNVNLAFADFMARGGIDDVLARYEDGVD